MKTAWWKYVLAVLAFIAMFFLAPIVLGLLLTITNWFSPEYFKSSAEWILVFSEALGIGCALGAAEKIVPERHVFLIVLSVICAFYCVGVGVWNFALGTTEGINMISMIAGGVVAILYTIHLSRALEKAKREQQEKGKAEAEVTRN